VENIRERHSPYAIPSSSFGVLAPQNDVAFKRVWLVYTVLAWRIAPAFAYRLFYPLWIEEPPLRQVETFSDMSGPQIPPGQTWFDTHKTPFQDVPVDPSDKGIATSEFLEAAESTTTLFGGLSSTLDWSFC